MMYYTRPFLYSSEKWYYTQTIIGKTDTYTELLNDVVLCFS